MYTKRQSESRLNPWPVAGLVLTLPVAAVELDAHAHGARVRRVGHEADAPSDNRGVHLTQFRDVRVPVAREHLKIAT